MKTLLIHDNGTQKTSALVAQLKKKRGVYSYWNDKALDELFPVPSAPTTRYFADSVEPDMLGKSRDDIGDTPIMNLREYVLMWLQSDKEFDVKGGTILSERLPDGRVADGYWNPDNRQVYLNWNFAGNCNPNYGARAAISLTSHTYYDPLTGKPLAKCPTCGRE